ncbi:very-short-patch-repair endonuclease [Kaistia hirudinis]|uniref:Very-short-patch-repair endonuclease n=1 Tax=Kaistia hirudinis TaxID=1293440 RepID=A0A840AN18_9HYPH|nr:endonuclease domain-containing protein [Kaistia hirudinis]MBB3930437.1 very-short-patch-repair endonuclease [Kaistia hirudinis]
MTGSRKSSSNKPVAPLLRQRSHELRQAMSEPEQIIWKHLRAHRFHGLGFRRQVPIAGCVVDFVCHERRLIVEIDGATHGADEAIRRDEARTRRLEAEGYRVVRYWNNDIMTNLDGVLLDLVGVLAQEWTE